MATKKSVEKAVIKKMKELGTYRPEFRDIINIYSGMLHQYMAFEEQFEGSGYQITEEYTNKAGAVNDRKVPLYTAMESLRKDIATYSDRLALNPKAVDSIKLESATRSKLSMVLGGLED